MARIKLAFPEAFQFETVLDVRISDINYGRHLGNDAVLALAHEARLRYLAANGFSEKDVGGVGLIMLDAAIVYRAQARWGDRLSVRIAVGEIGACDFDLYYRLARQDDGADIAVAKTTLAFFDYNRNRVVRTPPAFRQKISSAPA